MSIMSPSWRILRLILSLQPNIEDMDPEDATYLATLDIEVFLMGILAQLQRLETLSLDLYPGFEYEGELQGVRLPRLKELSFCWWDRITPRDLALDLLEAASESLRTLRLPNGPTPRPVVSTAAVGRETTRFSTQVGCRERGEMWKSHELRGKRVERSSRKRVPV